MCEEPPSLGKPPTYSFWCQRAVPAIRATGSGEEDGGGDGAGSREEDGPTSVVIEGVFFWGGGFSIFTADKCCMIIATVCSGV